MSLKGPTKEKSDGQWEEGHGVVHHVQWEQSYVLHNDQNASVQDLNISAGTQEVPTSADKQIRTWC